MLTMCLNKIISYLILSYHLKLADNSVTEHEQVIRQITIDYYN